jgi:hypothetical protein
MGARGRAAAALKQQQLSSEAAYLQEQRDQALHDFEQRSGGVPGDVYTFNPDPKVQKTLKAIQAVIGLIGQAKNARQAAKYQKKEQRLEKKLAKRELAAATKNQISIGAEIGPNAGYWREFGAPQPLWLSQRSH